MEETTSTETKDVGLPAGGSAAPTSTKDKIIELLKSTQRHGRRKSGRKQEIT